MAELIQRLRNFCRKRASNARHKQHRTGWLNWWAWSSQGKILAALLPLLGLLHGLQFSFWLCLWLVIEAIWLVYVRSVCVPRLASFHPEDAATPCSQEEFDKAIDNVCFLLKQDATGFWLRATGISFEGRSVPAAIIRSYVRSLLFMFEDNPAQAQMLERGVTRLAAFCGGAADEGNELSYSEQHNWIRGWSDDAHLTSIVSPTPFVMSVAMEACVYAAKLVLLLFGWRRGPSYGTSNLECFVYTPAAADVDPPAASESRPLVLIPGAGSGLVSFLPLALYLQRQLGSTRPHARQRARTIVLYRLMHVEIARPWAHLPQWSELVGSLVPELRELLATAAAPAKGGGADDGGTAREFDLVAHSYGTAVANRLLRELCLERRHPQGHGSLRVGRLHLIDPIVLGGASTGLVGCINQARPDISFAFAANRAGVTTKEVLDFDPRAHEQCLRGIGVYLSHGDVLLDVPLARELLARHIPTAECVVDETRLGFHGRWLVEFWAGGLVWGAPCATRCVRDLLCRLT